jgi:GTPase
MPRDMISTRAKRERVILVGVDSRRSKDKWPIERSLDELAQLCKTAGAEIVGRLVQKMDRPSSTHYLGPGKLEELVSEKERLNLDAVVFDDELAPRQQLNLEEALGIKVIDRTALILDIFAQSARTREGKLQVELAQNQYLLPRLAGQWSHLERLGGGIGTRGPGESQIETDRRLVRTGIARIKERIEAVRRHRELYRNKREKAGTPLVALVGYTNAGKSTLLNAISDANVVAENKLFSTLDPVTRRLRLPQGQTILITDTVGFIHKLPPLIIAAFRATLEELDEASLLLHVVDITSNDAVIQSETVERILRELGLDEKPRLTVINKIDRMVVSPDQASELALAVKSPPASTVVVSAEKKWNLDGLLRKIESMLEQQP